MLQVYGLLGMYISVPALDGAYMQNMSIDVVANFFNIPLERDEEISTGIYMAKPVRLSGMSLSCNNSTGE